MAHDNHIPIVYPLFTDHTSTQTETNPLSPINSLINFFWIKQLGIIITNPFV